MAAPQPRYLGRNLCSLHFQLAESFQEFQVSTQHFDSTAAEEVQGCRSWYLYGQLRHGAGMEEALEHSHPYSISCISKHATRKHYFKSCPRFTQLPRARSTFILALARAKHSPPCWLCLHSPARSVPGCSARQGRTPGRAQCRPPRTHHGQTPHHSSAPAFQPLLSTGRHRYTIVTPSLHHRRDNHHRKPAKDC